MTEFLIGVQLGISIRKAQLMKGKRSGFREVGYEKWTLQKALEQCLGCWSHFFKTQTTFSVEVTTNAYVFLILIRETLGAASIRGNVHARQK